MAESGREKVSGQGRLPFALLLVTVAVFLAISYPGQTTRVDGASRVAQPGFWSAVGVAGMAVFAGLHMIHTRPFRLRMSDLAEGWRWIKAFEFAFWFLAYVYLVPRVGYVFASVLFVPALTSRMGYRGAKWFGLATGFAITVVVLFKAMLEVKIPGGMIYEYFPDALRTFFIVNL